MTPFPSQPGSQPAAENGSPAASRRVRAYAAGARIPRETMQREAPLDADALRRVEASDIVVVRGSYDRVEQVLDALAMPYTTVSPDDVAGLRLRDPQTATPEAWQTSGVTTVRSAALA